MALRRFPSISFNLLRFNGQQVRHGHRVHGKPPHLARTLKQRLEELNQEDTTLTYKVDIGFPSVEISKKDMFVNWSKEIKIRKKDVNLEKQARKCQITVDLNKIREVWWITNGPRQIYTIAKHYGIYNDLYGDAYFIPNTYLEIDYDIGSDDVVARVYRGNVIKPIEASNPPTITYNSSSDTLWTLLMTTPDGNMKNSNNEYCHWFMGNIPGNEIAKGEQLIDYLRPIPPRGLGYCRYIFVLYKQDKYIDYTKYKKELPCLNLSERDWNTYEFYKEHQDYITPAGLAFFQSDWDPSLTDFYHSTLQTMEPVFQYDFPEPYVRPQEWFPLKRAFNLYLDRYRDPKKIQEEFLLRKLKKIHPFKGPEPPLKYPNAYAFDKYMPTWLRLEKTKERLGWGRVNNLNE